jgi:hypothetical protein
LDAAEKNELLLVDGPPQNTASLVRLSALPRLLHRLADSVTIILDDAAREAETEIVKHQLQFALGFSATYSSLRKRLRRAPAEDYTRKKSRGYTHDRLPGYTRQLI